MSKQALFMNQLQDFTGEIKIPFLYISIKNCSFRDSKSGYYYNPSYDLYFNGKDGNWYRLNPVTNEFIFHSATEATKAAKKVDL